MDDAHADGPTIEERLRSEGPETYQGFTKLFRPEPMTPEEVAAVADLYDPVGRGFRVPLLLDPTFWLTRKHDG